ncbi:hypothetical protein [Ramlibacter albus]|uniref:Uncharacterized protein n=1 Tax=Ramlibacter albus TaxID=2079448 RepID=A0A923S0Q8_9BURK|nr:hypothetical protein [Ramlibacter albus]MBC5763624.1 hypothetical protein [Ramlibacter albus]
METVIVFVDDADYAHQQLAPVKNQQPTHWVVVGCAPQLTRRAGKWVSQSARQQWRARWCEKLFSRVTPQLAGAEDKVTTVIAKRPLPQLTRELLMRHGAGRVFDARRPKFGHQMDPVTADQPVQQRPAWEVPGAIAGLGAALVLAAE